MSVGMVVGMKMASITQTGDFRFRSNRLNGGRTRTRTVDPLIKS